MEQHKIKIDISKCVTKKASKISINKKAVTTSNEARLVYYTDDANKFIYYNLPKSFKKDKRMAKINVALILLIIDLYRMRKRILKGHKIFPEWCKNHRKKYFEKQIEAVSFINEVTDYYGISVEQKIIEKVWKLAIDYMASIGIIDKNEVPHTRVINGNKNSKQEN